MTEPLTPEQIAVKDQAVAAFKEAQVWVGEMIQEFIERVEANELPEALVVVTDALAYLHKVQKAMGKAASFSDTLRARVLVLEGWESRTRQRINESLKGVIHLRISDLIFKLRELQELHGDHEVVNEEDKAIDVEFQPADQTMQAAYVIS